MFAITGFINGRQFAVTWYEPGDRLGVGGIGRDRGLDGDCDLVLRVMLDEVEQRTFAATPTGPFIQADLDDPHAAVIQLSSYFRAGS